MEINLFVTLKTFIVGVMVSRTFCEGTDYIRESGTSLRETMTAKAKRNE